MEQEKEKIIELKLETLKEEAKKLNFDLEYFKKLLKPIPVKYKHNKDKHLQTLLKLQCFQADNEQIWSVVVSNDDKYIATGGKSGVLKIWQIYSFEESIINFDPKNMELFLKFINENPVKMYAEHTNDIIDIVWSQKVLSNLFNFKLE